MGIIIPLVVFGLIIIGVIYQLIIPALVFSFILLFSSFKIVTPNTVKTVELLGRFNRVLRPGLNFIIPFLEWTKNQNLIRQNLSIDVEGITSDNVTAYIGLNVIYYVKDDGLDSVDGSIYKSVYSITDPRGIISATIEEQLRSMMSSFTHKEIFEKREEIGSVIGTNLKEKLSEFGYSLDSIQVKNIKLDASVMTAMNKVVESLKIREAATNEGEAAKIKLIKEAEADREAKVLIGQGMAGQRMEIAKGFKESVEMIKSADSSLDGDKILKFLLDSSRIETLGNIGTSDKTKLIYLNESLEGTSSSKLLAGSEMMK